MKRTVISGITLNSNPKACEYKGADKSIRVSDRAAYYPVNPFLEMLIEPEDELKVILLAKNNETNSAGPNTELFKAELEAVNASIGARIEYVVIDTDFEESSSVHVQLLDRLVDEIEEGAHVIADITYGPKDMPVEVMSALRFAEKFLDASIDNIIYGQIGHFENGEPKNGKLCDMSSLFYLSALTEKIKCDDADKARQMLKTLISF